MELELLQRVGDISALVPHETFTIQHGFRRNGKAIRPMEFTPDFHYRDDRGRWVVEDFKGAEGMETEPYKMRKKMFLCVHKPDIYRTSYTVRIVDE